MTGQPFELNASAVGGGMTATLRALQVELAANPLTAAFASGELEAGLADYERQLRDGSTDPDELEYELYELEHKLQAGLKAAGKSDEERCDIAASLAAGWACDCWEPFRGPQMYEEFISSALAAVLLDRPLGKRRAEKQRLMPRMLEAIKSIEADWARERAERALVDSIRRAQSYMPLDRETLGLPPDGDLALEQIEVAKAAAEKAAGLAKNGKPFKRFANAAERLTLAVSYVIETTNGDRQ
jgi:hypothetical protein